MAKKEELKTLMIDMEKNIYEVNGRDISHSGKYMSLEFQNGMWSLAITEDTIYSSCGYRIKE